MEESTKDQNQYYCINNPDEILLKHNENQDPIEPVEQPLSEIEVDIELQEQSTKTKKTPRAKDHPPPKYPNIEIGKRVNGRWKIIELIGTGGFGAVYKVIADGKKGTIEAAMKIEGTKKWRIETFKDSKDPKLRRRINCPEVLKMEVSVLKRMNNVKCSNVCTLYDQGKNEHINYIVVSLIGKNLRATQQSLKNHVFTLSTTIRASLQTLEALRSLHQIGFLHRDIKPQNFAIGTGKKNRTIFMLDFGLARKFRTACGKNLPARKNCNFRGFLKKPFEESINKTIILGTPYYASMNVHNKLEQGPHDDLWSWFYMIIDFRYGKLPWATADRSCLGEEKAKINPFTLISSLPEELFPIHKHLTSLKYPTIPKYPKIIYCLEQIIERFNIKESEPYDWEVVATENENNEIEKQNTPKPNRGPNEAVMKTYNEYTNLYGHLMPLE